MHATENIWCVQTRWEVDMMFRNKSVKKFHNVEIFPRNRKTILQTNIETKIKYARPIYDFGWV